MNIVDDQLASLNKYIALRADLQKTGFKHALLIGMGGSSLGPEVLASTFGHISGFPELYMLDSTVPAQIQFIESEIDMVNTIFIVSSKSGSTLEPNILMEYFLEKAKSQLGSQTAAKHFIAITDPGSLLEQKAKAENFRYIFHGVPSIGGRYSILSAFGMVPAVVMGIDLARFLEKAKSMEQSCAANIPVASNPGALLGITIGVLVNQGKNKITLVTSPKIASFGSWVEQLLAESTGKGGKGVIPIIGENIDSISNYNNDRLFIYIRLNDQDNSLQDKQMSEIQNAGLPVVRIELNDVYDLAKEFFRFEFATAVAGSVMGINPFDQPDVEAAKIATRNITDEYEKSGSLELAAPRLTETNTESPIEVFADEPNWRIINRDIKESVSLLEVLHAFFGQVQTGDYVAILAYIQMNKENEKLLQNIRNLIHTDLKIATCLGFGPRFLHSTGQVYKGGPNTGLFLEITADDTIDLPVPGKKFTFGVVKTAQAVGDFQVLCERKRRVLRLHVKGNLSDGLASLQKTIAEACRAII